MTKLKTIAVAVMVASVSTMASATTPPAVPTGYENGPLPPNVNTTAMTTEERAAFAMMEGIMQITEGKIHSDGCNEADYPVSVYASVFHNEFTASISGVDLMSAPQPSNFRGQKVVVWQPVAGTVGGTMVGNYNNTLAYNAANNMMTGKMYVDILGANGSLDQYSGHVIKDFYMGTDHDQYQIFDWGLQSL